RKGTGSQYAESHHDSAAICDPAVSVCTIHSVRAHRLRSLPRSERNHLIGDTDKMLTNHLIIGLGGTGGKILRSFRKTVYQQFRAENPSGVNVRFLYVDSSDEMMGYNDPTWRILGQNVQLPKTSQLLISGLNL